MRSVGGREVLSVNRTSRPTKSLPNNGLGCKQCTPFRPRRTAYVMAEYPAGVVPRPVLLLLENKPDNPFGRVRRGKGLSHPPHPGVCKIAGHGR